MKYRKKNKRPMGGMYYTGSVVTTQRGRVIHVQKLSHEKALQPISETPQKLFPKLFALLGK